MEEVLLAATPSRWFEVACEQWRELLVDHANCEKKAASTALSLIFAYAEDSLLAERLSRLAREELRHFEQVQKMMRELQVPFMRMSPSRYAEGLRRMVRTRDPGRLIDLLLCGALIEARSCERFERLAPMLKAANRPGNWSAGQSRNQSLEPLGRFYAGLAESEARHYKLYLDLAEPRAGDFDWRIRLQEIAAVEADLATSADKEFRFHSGEPVMR